MTKYFTTTLITAILCIAVLAPAAQALPIVVVGYPPDPTAPTYLTEVDDAVAECANIDGVAYCVIQNTGTEDCTLIEADEPDTDGTLPPPRTECVPVPCLVNQPNPNCPTIPEQQLDAPLPYPGPFTVMPRTMFGPYGWGTTP